MQEGHPSCRPRTLSGTGRTKPSSSICRTRASSAVRLSLTNVPANTESTKRVFLKRWLFLFVPRPWKSLFNHCQSLGLRNILQRRTARAKGVLGAKDFLLSPHLKCV